MSSRHCEYNFPCIARRDDFKYKLKHCRKYFIFIKYEQGDALNDLWNFLVLAYSHTLKLVINKRNTNHYSHITT